MFRVQCCCSVLQHLFLGISFVHHHTHYLPFLHTLTSTSPMCFLPLVTPAHRLLSGFSHRLSQQIFHCPFSAGGATAPMFPRSLYHRSSSPQSTPPTIINLDAACRPSSFGGHSQADDASHSRSQSRVYASPGDKRGKLVFRGGPQHLVGDPVGRAMAASVFYNVLHENIVKSYVGEPR